MLDVAVLQPTSRRLLAAGRVAFVSSARYVLAANLEDKMSCAGTSPAKSLETRQRYAFVSLLAVLLTTHLVL